VTDETSLDGGATAEERAARAEAALREALAERNRLWHELQHREADARDAAELRRRLDEIKGSGWWRAGAPLRLIGAVVRDPGWALGVLARRLER
jgi:hypothetical protein